MTDQGAGVGASHARYTNDPSGLTNDDWYRSYDQKTRMSAALGSEDLRDRIQRTGQALAPSVKPRRLTFAEQLALVASGRARIVEWPPR